VISPEVINHLPEFTSLALPLILAFSGKVRDRIIGRAGNRSELSGVESDVTLHASHLNHDQSRPEYDTAENGIALTPKEHLIYHRVHRGRAQEIGLTEEDNESAIALLSFLVNKKK